MAVYLLCSSPIHGHLAPMLTIAKHLVGCGHEVSVLTGSRFRQDIEKTGASARALTGLADFDDRVYLDELPAMQRLKGVARVAAQGLHLFSEPISEQYQSVQAAIDELDPAVVLYESLFAGILPLLQVTEKRPTVMGIGVIPLIQLSKDSPPFGPGLTPMPGAVGRLRNGLLNTFVEHVVFRKANKHANFQLQEMGFKPISSLFVDYMPRYSDKYLQLCPAEFEYPRGDLSSNIQFVGPLLPPPNTFENLPAWWSELEETTLPVVHVTQGTLDNKDFTRLIRPTMDALENKAVLVIVATGGRPIEEIGELPANVRVAEYLPYDKLMQLTNVFVTNAGYGGTQYALSHGVPIVAAGDTEDKKEVSARVSWAGVGINLKSGTPSAAAIGKAVAEILADSSFQTSAKSIAASCAQLDALSSIEQTLDGLAAR